MRYLILLMLAGCGAEDTPEACVTRNTDPTMQHTTPTSIDATVCTEDGHISRIGVAYPYNLITGAP